MPDLQKRRRSTGAGGTGRRVVIILMTLFSLIVVFAGIASLAMGVQQQQQAARLAAAPVCPPGQQHPESTPCRLDERVTVIDRYSDEAGRSGYTSQVVQVQTPDGRSQTMYSHDQDFGLWDRLQVHEQVNAELWEGNVVRLDDGAGHYLLAGDDPGGSYGAGGLLTVLGVLMLGFFVRVLWRDRHTYG